MIDQTKNPIAFTIFWFLIGSAIGTGLGSFLLAHYGINPLPMRAEFITYLVVAGLINMTWGKK